MGKRKTVKQILYSDKSETSVEDLMDDTPSNYNIQNGRFDGKSQGFKGLLSQASKANASALQNATRAFLGGLGADRSPQAASSKVGNLQTSGMLGAQKGIIGSQHDERNFINGLYQNGRMN